jgi:hypothetical protein
MRGAFLAEEEEQLLDEAGHARQRDPVAPEDRRARGEMRPEQLVGGIDEMELHDPSGPFRGGFDELAEILEIPLEDPSKNGRQHEGAEMGEQWRHDCLRPTGGRGRVAGDARARLELDQALPTEGTFVPVIGSRTPIPKIRM